MAKANGDNPLARLAASLERYGIDAKLSDSVAKGVVLALREWCWAEQTDLLGTAADIDEIVRLPLPAQSLGRILLRAKVVGLTKGRFFLPSAYSERPVYIDKRWRRNDAAGYKAAKLRASRRIETGEVPPPPPPPPESGVKMDLFGQPLVDVEAETGGKIVEKSKDTKAKNKKGKSNGGVPGYQEVVDYWFEHWATREGGGTPYPFGPTDGAIIKRLIQRTPSVEHAKRVLDAYLRETDRFYAGKPLKKLDLPRYIAAAANGGRHGAREIRYSAHDADLPDA